MWIRRRILQGLVVSITLLSTACALLGTEDTPVATIAPTDVPSTEIPTPPAATPTPTAVVVAMATEVPTEAVSEIDFAPLAALIEHEMAAAQVPGLAVAVIHQGVPRSE